MSTGQISRDGPTPTYATYCTSYCIVDPSSSPPISREDYDLDLQSLAMRSYGTPGPQDIVIPSWQRKLIWKLDDIDDLVNTQSSMYGSVILSRGIEQTQSWLLIDGLQRLSVGTALLNALYVRVLSPDPSNKKSQSLFTTVSKSLNQLSPVFKWNHDMLMKHGRSGIKSSYSRLYNSIEKYVDTELETRPNEFAIAISKTFLLRQVAIDVYAGFMNRGDLIKTFLEINRTGQLLIPTDLLRAELIDQMEKKGIISGVIDEIENDFTEVFQPSKANSFFNQLGTQIYNVMFKLDDTAQLGSQTGGTVIEGHDPEYVFPNWKNIGKTDFDDLFEYVSKVWELTSEPMQNDKTKWKWPYLAEISNFKLPFSMIIWYYYKNHYQKFLTLKNENEYSRMLEIQAELLKIPIAELENRMDAKAEIDFSISKNQARKEITKIVDDHAILKRYRVELEDAEETKNEQRISELNVKIQELENIEEKVPNLFTDLPDFLDGDLDTQDDMFKFYRAMVRKVLDGNIGKTDKILHGVMRGTFNSVDEIANELNPDLAGGISEPPNQNWLRGRLLSVDYSSGYARLVFNACILPNRGKSVSSQPRFNPFIFKNATGFYNIDHLIPDSKSNKMLSGYNQLQSLVNLAPLERENNTAALAEDCRLKLSTSKIYDTIKQIHPYCKWLADTHYDDHKDDESVYPTSGTKKPIDPKEPESTKIHPLDSQVNLLEGKEGSIALERIEKLIEILAAKL